MVGLFFGESKSYVHCPCQLSIIVQVGQQSHLTLQVPDLNNLQGIRHAGTIPQTC